MHLQTKVAEFRTHPEIATISHALESYRSRPNKEEQVDREDGWFSFSRISSKHVKWRSAIMAHFSQGRSVWLHRFLLSVGYFASASNGAATRSVDDRTIAPSPVRSTWSASWGHKLEEGLHAGDTCLF